MGHEIVIPACGIAVADLEEYQTGIGVCRLLGPTSRAKPAYAPPTRALAQKQRGEIMIVRTMLAVATLVIGVTAVVAQSDPIAARKAMMKANGQSAGQGNKFMKGEEPFDLAKAQAIFASYQKAAADFGKLFPDSSKAGDTAALPAVWENKADFDAK